jgi:hypothetical protein
VRNSFVISEVQKSWSASSVNEFHKKKKTSVPMKGKRGRMNMLMSLVNGKKLTEGIFFIAVLFLVSDSNE